jgi:hypothetical protein
VEQVSILDNDEFMFSFSDPISENGSSLETIPEDGVICGTESPVLPTSSTFSVSTIHISSIEAGSTFSIAEISRDFKRLPTVSFFKHPEDIMSNSRMCSVAFQKIEI